VKDTIVGSCAYCSRAYGVKDEVQSAGVGLLDDYDGHPSIHSLARDGFQILTFYGRVDLGYGVSWRMVSASAVADPSRWM